MKNLTRAVAVAALCLSLVACLTKEEKDEAIDLALSDPPFAQMLEDNPYQVTDVRRPRYRTKTDALVDITFDAPMSIDDWPLNDHTPCDFPGGTPDPVGLRWVVDLETDEILLVTPLWEATSEWTATSCADV